LIIMRIVLSALLIVLWVASGHAAERITSFESRIRIETDGSLLVTEAITVIAEGRDIRRGIYRDFPTDYRTDDGETVRVGFDVEGVTRDGKTESWHTERLDNGVRVYMGRPDRFVRKGEHRYVLTYRTTGQIGYFEGEDELYWNVIGNGWIFPIAKVRAIVELPQGADPIDVAFYTGPKGAEGQDASVYRNGPGNLVFETTRTLAPREGLTVAVSWPSGFVEKPSAGDHFLTALGGAGLVMRGVVGLFVVLGVSLAVWHHVGRDPDEGAIYPRYTPPPGFSPAAARFVHRMGFDRKGFAAALVSLAVKGAIRIEEEGGAFTLIKVGEGEKLSPGEAALMRVLFPVGDQSIVMEQKNHRTFKRAIKALEARLAMDYEKVYFLRNRLWLIPGVSASLLAVGWIALSLPDPGQVLFMTLWIAAWMAGGYGLLVRLGGTWAAVRSGHAMTSLKALGGMVVMLPFTAGILMALYQFKNIVPVPVMVIVAALFGTNVLFYELMKRPTRLGERVRNALEGFRLYLSVAEKDRLDRAHEPEQTPELFEKYLPYAMALDVETAWGAKFKGVLERASREAGYHPAWYVGTRGFRTDFSGFGASLSGALAGAIASSSTAPGSSRGSGGGGFSGGGGGGGGGGGW